MKGRLILFVNDRLPAVIGHTTGNNDGYVFVLATE